MILPDVISKEPLGPIVRQNDPQFRDVGAWTLHALVAAAEFGITQENVAAEAETSQNPEIQRLLGKTGDFGAKLGLSTDWAVSVIATAAHNAEILRIGSASWRAILCHSVWTQGVAVILK